MPTTQRNMYCRFALLTVLLICGCSGTPSDQPPLAEVTGEVLMDGKPLPDAGVSFTPQAGSRGAYGKTDKDGRFRLGYARSYGAPYGLHDVKISTIHVIHNKDGETTGMSRETVPARYNTKTELTADVTKDGENFFKFELQSK